MRQGRMWEKDHAEKTLHTCNALIAPAIQRMCSGLQRVQNTHCLFHTPLEKWISPTILEHASRCPAITTSGHPQVQFIPGECGKCREPNLPGRVLCTWNVSRAAKLPTPKLGTSCVQLASPPFKIHHTQCTTHPGAQPEGHSAGDAHCYT
jgi:hypothetical protein